ncbi:alpha/beta-hydrolase [Aspergillus heteromorphus CBS 117.55]|uniref:Alpha/beta-hydrolase n=1 Tax=Aspergillus heteromorphus CBS 117.55 TaxID=1448321 RepID=A0A317WI77_9EURO|nr:alpha/beta-hydrolase [Aspergillus heteromorphus CBS 117.55]PWY85999.1 alpha/beta-hydrolase [Aspergillus heteromorphus CBS 117.55]
MGHSSEATPRTAPYGTWESPITAEHLTSAGINFTEVAATPDGVTYVIEARPAESGRCCIVEWREGQARDVLPAEYSARTAVQGYGGAAFVTAPDGNLIFSDAKTRGVYILNPATGSTVAVTEPDGKIYFADFDVHPTKTEWILAIREDHRLKEVVNELVAINSTTKEVQVVASGADFYTHPRFNSTGDRVCWMQWNHPDMPWTGTEVYTASWVDGKFEQPVRLAGQAGQESITQPRWGPDGTLFFLSDRSGYWQFFQWSPDSASAEPRPIIIKGLEDGEFSFPEWLLGSCTYVIPKPDTIVAAWTRNAADRLVIINLSDSTYEFLPSSPGTSLSGITTGRSMALTSSTSFAVIASTPTAPSAVYHIDLNDPSSRTTLRSSTTLTIPPEYFSLAEHVSFPRTTSGYTDTLSHAFFLPPTNPEYTAPPGSLPPLIISIHGGPTAHSDSGLSLMWQYYTTRGYAVAFLNYAGSSGYGRKYRELLNGVWGHLDVLDAGDCARYLSSSGRVNASGVGICGGSSGGYATLEAICVTPSLWAGAISISGISDVEALVAGTHKFESHYAFRLLFGDDVPKDEEVRRQLYRARSPRFHADSITAMTLIIQGTDDEIVPLNQAQAMADTIQANGGKSKLLVFEGEGHGHPRKSENALRAVHEEERWWRESLVEQENKVSNP